MTPTPAASIAPPSLSELTGLLEEAGLGSAGAAARSDVRVSEVRQDSRRVQPGELFLLRRGSTSDERLSSFARSALERGASAFCVEEALAPLVAPLGLPVLAVNHGRRALGLIAERIFGYPSRRLQVVAVTGTNGKTTCAWICQQALEAAGWRAGRLGTLGYGCGDDVVDSPLTTPEPDTVSRYLRRALDAGASHFVMEASSHALDQGRIDALRFAVGAFTNLTQDHLDYHGSMEAYAAAKALLFERLQPRAAVLNVDDTFGATLARRLRDAKQAPVSVGQEGAVRALAHSFNASGLTVHACIDTRELQLQTPLVGHHNLENVLLCLGIAQALGLDLERFAQGLRDLRQVPGRLERCDRAEDGVAVLVDYAHTPDALKRALQAVRPLTQGRVLCVFGCGGDRDPAKRPLMGSAVGEGADVAWITNDNPRSEDPQAIADQIVPGLEPHGIAYELELDRRQAIIRAVRAAEPGDVVLIAGKGHEPYQLIGDETFDFDDRVEARAALALRREVSV